MNKEEKNNKKEEIEVITGDSSDLDFSAVYDHIKNDNIDKKEDKKENKKIIIPKCSSQKNTNNNK